VTKNDQTTLMGPILATINTSSSRLSQRHPLTLPSEQSPSKNDTIPFFTPDFWTWQLDSTRLDMNFAILSRRYFIFCTTLSRMGYTWMHVFVTFLLELIGIFNLDVSYSSLYFSRWPCDGLGLLIQIIWHMDYLLL
jgi:hypothetical protein